jgi:large subunit ribosomal protein L4
MSAVVKSSLPEKPVDGDKPMSVLVTNLLSGKADTGDKIELTSALTQEMKPELVHQVIVAYQAGGRQGSAKQKTRGEVRCTGKKPWKQKGTGRARAGSFASPIWVGGGVTFAKNNRSYDQKVNRKTYRKVMAMLLAEQIRGDNVTVVSDIELPSSKTKALRELLEKNKLMVRRLLIVVSGDVDQNLYLSARNQYQIAITNVDAINPLEVYQADHLIVTKDAITTLSERYI